MKKYTTWAIVSLHNILFEFGRHFVEKSRRSFYFPRVQVSRKQENAPQMTPNWQIPYMHHTEFDYYFPRSYKKELRYFPYTYPQIEITFRGQVNGNIPYTYRWKKMISANISTKSKLFHVVNRRPMGFLFMKKPLLKIFCYSPFKHTVH